MKVCRLTSDGFSLAEQPTPECPPDGVLVKTTGCGVCGGDVFSYKNRQGLKEPYVPGHEGSGVVEGVGEDVDSFRIGDRVTAINGAFAEFFLARPEMLIRLPDPVDPKWALGEAVACCMHACNRLHISDSSRVVLLGCGFMGLVCLQLIRTRGPASICAADPLSWRRTLALELGADSACAPEDIPNVADPGWHGHYDIVLEAAGSASALALCGDLVAQHGQVNLVGYHISNDGIRSVNMKQWNAKSITVINGHVRRNDEKVAAMRQGMDLAAGGALELKSLVTCYPFSQADTAFQDMVNQKEGLVKAVLVPQ